MEKSIQHLLLFGGTGSIGQSITKKFLSDFGRVTIVTRQDIKKNHFSDEVDYIHWDPLSDDSEFNLPLGQKKYTAVCWAQGMNMNDSIRNFEKNKHQELYDANVLFIISSLNYLLVKNYLDLNARLLIVSSIWQEISRQNKLSYSVTKSALRGLVLSLANDLSKDGFLVNAILPGALDTEMTRSNLTLKQLEDIQKSTGFSRLPSLSDVSNLACHLLSNKNTGVTAQFIKIDLGFSDVRII
jgi:NAD(P)-dependent dehydrogenase (short-subunit alcohol dehydrogenase family)